MTSDVQKYQHRVSTDQLTVRGRDASPAATTAIGCEEPTLKAQRCNVGDEQEAIRGACLVLQYSREQTKTPQQSNPQTCCSKQVFWLSVPHSWPPSLSAPHLRTPPQPPPSKPEHRPASSILEYSSILNSSTSSSPRSTQEPSHGPMLTTQCSPAILAQLHALRTLRPRLNAGQHQPLTMAVRKREQMPLQPIPCLWLGISPDYPNMRKRQSTTWMRGQTLSKPIPIAMRRCKPAGQALHGLERQKSSVIPTLVGPRLTSPNSRTCYEMSTSLSSSLDLLVTAIGNSVSLFLLLPSFPLFQAPIFQW